MTIHSAQEQIRAAERILDEEIRKAYAPGDKVRFEHFRGLVHDGEVTEVWGRQGALRVKLLEQGARPQDTPGTIHTVSIKYVVS